MAVISELKTRSKNLCQKFNTVYPFEADMELVKFPIKANTFYSINFNATKEAYKTIWLYDNDGNLTKKVSYAYAPQAYDKMVVFSENYKYMSVGVLDGNAKVMVAEGQYFTLNTTQQNNLNNNKITTSVSGGELPYEPYYVNITKYNNDVISNINYNSVDYHFAKNTENIGGYCDNAVEEPIIDMQIKGNSVQNGTPTPETPIEIESVGNKTKNLFNGYSYIDKNPNATISNNILSFYDNQNSMNYPIYENENISEVSQVTCSFKIRRLDNYVVFVLFYTDGTSENKVINQNEEFVNYNITSNANKTIQKIYLNYNHGLLIEIDLSASQIELGDTATEYEPYGYKVPVNIKDDLYNPNTIVNGKYITSRGDDVETTQLFRTDYFPVLANEEYLLKIYATRTNVVSFAWYDTNKTFISRSSSEQITGEIEFKAVAPSNAVYAICNIIKDSTNISITGVGETINIYLNEPLRKVGDYADYIDYKNKKVIRSVAEKVFDGTERISKNNKSFQYVVTDGVKPTSPSGKPAFCNYYKISSEHVKIYNGIVSNVFILSSSYFGANCLFNIADNRFSIASEFMEYLKELYDSSNPLKLVYPLATPTEETIDIPEIYTQKGTNIFEIQTTIQPSELKINYWKQI